MDLMTIGVLLVAVFLFGVSVGYVIGRGKQRHEP